MRVHCPTIPSRYISFYISLSVSFVMRSFVHSLGSICFSRSLAPTFCPSAVLLFLSLSLCVYFSMEGNTHASLYNVRCLLGVYTARGIGRRSAQGIWLTITNGFHARLQDNGVTQGNLCQPYDLANNRWMLLYLMLYLRLAFHSSRAASLSSPMRRGIFASTFTNCRDSVFTLSTILLLHRFYTALHVRVQRIITEEIESIPRVSTERARNLRPKKLKRQFLK